MCSFYIAWEMTTSAADIVWPWIGKEYLHKQKVHGDNYGHVIESSSVSVH